jgi:DNA replication protein DnaD
MKNDNKIIERSGWICLHRKSIESTVFENPFTWQVWTWCLMKANHEEKEIPFNGKDIMIKRGQFVTGQTKALKEMKKMSARKYRTSITYLKSTNRITCRPTNKFTIITVCKYEDYQNINNQTDKQINKQTTNHRQTTDKPPTNHRQQTTLLTLLTLFFRAKKSI